MAIDKLEIINQITEKAELQKLVSTILKSMSFSGLVESEDYLTGQYITPFETQNFIFFSSPVHLSKTFDLFLADYELLKKNLKVNRYSAVYIVSSKNITEGFKGRIEQENKNVQFRYWNNESIVEKVDAYYADYWRHNDQDLINYEKKFQEELNNDWSVNKIKQFKSAHEKLLKIFVEPKLLHKVNDFESSKRKALVRINYNDLLSFERPVMFQGEAGIGKTRLLKQIGVEFIKLNTRDSGNKKYLPIFINNIDLIESRKSPSELIDLSTAVQNKLSKAFSSSKVVDILSNYQIVFLIDSLDDFSKENQKKLLSDLKTFNDIKFFFGSRFHEFSSISGIDELGKCEEVYVEKFSDQQIRHFVSLYFQNDRAKADNLLYSLKENSIIQRLPITPLNLSLISILYEENNFEIPATITDIYDNFSNLLLGRTLPESKFDFFDITIRERILSVYALELIKKGEKSYMSIQEFKDFFKEFFNDISGTINIEMLPEALDFLVNNTGVLVIQNDRHVKFMHESYMEYYASREIFNHRREFENDLVERFFDITWQYTAIFYAGRTKQMEVFLNNIINRVKNANKNIEFYKSIHGLGYISQALYMTSDKVRMEAVKQALTSTLEVYNWMAKLSADEKYFFKTLSMPVAAVVNSMLFFDKFNSITLRKPLELVFDELFPKLTFRQEGKDVLDYNVAYKVFTIALTMASPRIGNLEPMKKLIYESPLLKIELFEKLLDFGLSIAGNKTLYEMKKELPIQIKKNKTSDIITFNKEAEDFHLNTPLGRIRFSKYDTLHTDRKVLLLTEGKTDAQIIEHAFVILTDQIPYWEIRPISAEDGGAVELAKCLSNGAGVLHDEPLKVIGIFDNDAKGIQEFNGEIRLSKFDFFENSQRIKKHKEADIYAMKLPIPHFRENYLQESQVFNFFSIEHYFDDDLLRSKNMLIQTPILNVFKIAETKSAKSDFSKFVRGLDDKKLFRHFVHLFHEIDFICGRNDIEYEY